MTGACRVPFFGHSHQTFSVFNHRKVEYGTLIFSDVIVKNFRVDLDGRAFGWDRLEMLGEQLPASFTLYVSPQVTGVGGAFAVVVFASARFNAPANNDRGMLHSDDASCFLIGSLGII